MFLKLNSLIILLSCTFFISTIILCLYILTLEECHCRLPYTPLQKQETTKIGDLSQHKLAILVPFRDRFEEMLAFIPHIDMFLKRQNVKHSIFILNQVDTLRFNRASLVNVGFKLTRDNFDYFAIHDVDLLPLRDELSYKYPNEDIFHLSSPDLHPKYHYASFLGGILLFKRDVFEKVNGMSNRYWGWGLEDDELYTRLKSANVLIGRPKAITTNYNNTFLHIHEKERRRRDTRKCFNQLAVTRRRDRATGLHDVNFRIESNVSMTINRVDFTVFNIALVCDYQLTPWCQCDRTVSNAAKT